MDAVEDGPFFRCRKVVPISEVMSYVLRSVEGRQCVCSVEFVLFWESIIRGSITLVLVTVGGCVCLALDVYGRTF